MAYDTDKLVRALRVLVLTPSLRAMIDHNDPKAIEQAEEALIEQPDINAPDSIGFAELEAVARDFSALITTIDRGTTTEALKEGEQAIRLPSILGRARGALGALCRYGHHTAACPIHTVPTGDGMSEQLDTAGGSPKPRPAAAVPPREPVTWQPRQYYSAIQLSVSALRETYPLLDLKFGYIGNCERWGDERSWSVWAEASRKPKSYGFPGVVIMQAARWGDYPSASLGAMAAAIDEGRLREWCEKLMQGVSR